MHFSGWAFSANEREQSEEILAKYYQLIQIYKGYYTIDKKSQYNKVAFTITFNLPEEELPSEYEALIIADQGNLCFGGTCNKHGNKYIGVYYTD